VVITDVRTLEDVILQSTGERRLNAWLFGSFGVLALGLAAIGVAGVISYSVASRTREFGLRLALGATPSQVRRLIVRESLPPVLAGMAAGLAAALMLSRFVASLLYGIEPRDVSTYAGASVLLIGTALVAAYLPGRRASRIDPIVALRVE
jgi:putative ABC transport system permease protein